MAAPAPAMRSILLRPALTFDQRRFRVSDLVLAGLADGTWTALERAAAAGMDAERRAAASEGGPPADLLREAARAFRYEQRLLAREDLDAWLEARGLSVDDWRGYLRRRLARERSPHAPAGPDPAAVLRVDAICSGTLRHAGERVVAGAAAERALTALGAAAQEVDEPALRSLLGAARASAAGLDAVPPEELERDARGVLALAEAERALAAAVASPEAVAAFASGRALEWLTFRTEELAVADEDAGREARLWVDEDGATLAEVAAAIPAPLVVRRRVFAETPEELRARLVAAGPGETVGPVGVDGSFVVARLVAKTLPAMDDPEVVDRATRELVGEAIGRHAAARVTWHVAL